MVEVLVIDDNLVMRRNIKNMVEQLGHTVVGEAEDGNEAVYKYKECEPDVVTLDIVMPVVDGIEALKRLRGNDPEAKVIMVTSLGHKSKVLKAIELGASHYVVKPIKVEDLSRVLNEVLGEESKSIGEPSAEEHADREQEDKEANGEDEREKDLADNNNKQHETEEDIELEEEEGVEEQEEKIAEDLEKQVDNIRMEGMDDLKPLEVLNKEGVLKIKINKTIDKDLLDTINETVEGFFIIEPLEIHFDLIGVDFESRERRKELDKLISKIEAVGGEVEKVFR
ncbi:MAG: response regulator [Halanaerobacter sp.]